MHLVLVAVALVGSSPRLAAQPLEAPALPLAKHAEGNIVFSRYQPQQIAGTTEVAILPGLFVMNGDGTNVRPFFTPGEYVSAKEARWSPDYDQLVFTSDFRESRSACSMDLWLAQADGSRMVRVTGADTVTPGAHGSVVGTITDNLGAQGGGRAPMGVQHTEVNITVPGSEVIYHPNPDLSFELPLVPAGEQVWIRVWIDKFRGNVVTREILPNQVNNVGAIPLQGMNLIADRGSVTPDGRYVVGMGGMVSLTERGTTMMGGEQKEIGGAESLAVYDMTRGGQIAAMFQATKTLGMNAKDPVMGPDGKSIACCWGRAVMENLAIINLDQMLADKPNPAIIVPGQNLFPSAATGFQAILVSAATPAWRPDGKQLAFCRMGMGTEAIAGDIWLANLDGSGLKQLTKVGVDHLACQPCYSPDGRKLVFTVLAGKFGLIKPEHIALRQFTANLFRINADGSGLQQLTQDGLSTEPAWGP